MGDSSVIQGTKRLSYWVWSLKNNPLWKLLEHFRFLFPRLCLSITDFHPDTWNPAWSVSTILTGLLSFMVEKGPTLGSIETSDYTVSRGEVASAPRWCQIRDFMLIFHWLFQKRQLSAQSLAFNLKDKVFCELFPDVVDVSQSLTFSYVLSIGVIGAHWFHFLLLVSSPRRLSRSRRSRRSWVPARSPSLYPTWCQTATLNTPTTASLPSMEDRPRRGAPSPPRDCSSPTATMDF